MLEKYLDKGMVKLCPVCTRQVPVPAWKCCSELCGKKYKYIINYSRTINKTFRSIQHKKKRCDHCRGKFTAKGYSQKYCDTCRRQAKFITR